jgi:hypothetical protein
MMGDAKTKRLWRVMLVLLLLSAGAAAQVEYGDLSMNLNGALGVGYGGSFGSYGASNHSLNFNGYGNLSGFYYNPRFLSFNVLPYYSRSQNNSASQSIFDSSGVTATVNLFNGSKFPGWVSYGKTFNGSNDFGIPGVTGLTTEGSSQNFGVGWSAFVPNWPTLSASFMTSSNNSTLLGTTGATDSASKSFNLTSNYTFAGWRLDGNINHQTMDLTIPEFFAPISNTSSSSSMTYGISASHSLPLSGSFGASWMRSSFSSEGTGRSDGTTNTLNALAVVSPTPKLTVTGDFRYITNVLGAFQENIVGPIGVPIIPLDNSSHSMSFGSSASYALGHGFTMRGYINHRQQFYYGEDISDTIFGGTLNYNYARPLFGLLSFSFGMLDTANEQGNNGVGMVASVSMNRRFGSWDTSLDFSYAQDVQTLLALYTTSSMTYGGTVRRKVNNNTYWTATARAAHSALTQQEGEGNSSYNFTTGLSWRKYSVTGGYATSAGTTVLGASGLLTPVPGVGILPDNIVLFNGRAYSVTASMSPLKKLAIYGSYANATSDIDSYSVFSMNKTEMVNGRLEYRLRKLSVIGGFTRYRQGISASGAPPSVVNSYTIGITRWFNVF